MDVANPIYDVVFKYLMQNQRVARLLIGRITGLAVHSLTVSPQETAVPRTAEGAQHDLPLTLLRMDFAARVQTEDGGERQVLIEIQKANAPTVIERFRRYLGQQIGSRDNILSHPSGRTEAVPIVTIYLLGYALDDLSDETVIDVCPRVTERRTGRELAASPSAGRGSPSPQPHHPDTAADEPAAGRVGAGAGDLRPGSGEGQRAR